MIFQWDPDVPLVVDENIELPQLQLIKNYTADCTQVYSTGNFTCLEVIFVLKRRLGYYLFHTYVPTCLIVIMSWLSFWIKPEAAPARVTLGVTSLLTLSTQHAKSQASLPPVSYLKAVDAFMSVCTIFVFMALMEYCLINIVLVLGEDSPKPATTTPAAGPPPPPPPAPSHPPPPPDKLERIFDITNKCTCMPENAILLSRHHHKAVPVMPPMPPMPPIPPAPPAPAAPPPQPAPPAPSTPAKPSKSARAKLRAINIDRTSRFLFPALFACLNISYWIIFWKYI